MSRRGTTAITYQAGQTPRYFPTFLSPSKENKENAISTKTPNGSKLQRSPSKEISFSVALASGETHHSRLILLERAEQHQPKTQNSLFTELRNHAGCNDNKTNFFVSANSKTCSGNRRVDAPKEKRVVGHSADDIVMAYCKANNICVTRNEVNKLQFNLCHGLAFSIANNGVTKEGEVFNSQIAENILAGTRILNENMRCIEMIVLRLMQEKQVTVEYAVTYSEFPGSHIYSDLTLSVCIVLNNTTISFEYPFDVAENRKLPNEFSKTLCEKLADLIDQYSDTYNTRRALSFE